MAKTFIDLWNELKGDIPAMSPFKAQQCVQRAWHDIRESRHWTFLIREGILYAPSAVGTGSVTVTQFSDQVVGDATAGAAWASLVLPASGLDITSRQFRVPLGPIYNISAHNPATFTLTLDRKYMEVSASGAEYQIYRCYYEAPDSDFLRWISFRDPVNRFRFRRHNLHRNRTELDRADPIRSTTGTPYWMVSHHANLSTGAPVFELWPHPTAEVSYQVAYSVRGVDFAATGVHPEAVSDQLLMSGARIKAYDWCAANGSRFPELGGINWLYLKKVEQDSYDKDLQRHKRQDEETFRMNWSEDEDIGGPPIIDGSWLQSHDWGPGSSY